MFKELLRRHGSVARSLIAVLVVSSCALVLAACGSDNSSSTSASGGSTSSGGSKSAFKIGIPAPLTGCCGSAGEDIKAAAQLAADDVNKSGGIDGHKVVLDVQDDACEAQQGVQAAQKLVADKVIAVVGGYCSSAALPGQDVFLRAGGIPFILPSQSNPKLTDPGHPNISRVIGRDDDEGPVDAAYLKNVIKSTKVAILDDKTEFSVSTAAQITKALKELGGVQVVMHDSITPAGKDYRAALEKVKSSGADTLMYAGFYPEYGIIAKQWAAGKYPFKLVGGTSTIDYSVPKVAPAAVESPNFAFITYPFSYFVPGPKADAYRTAYKQATGRPAESIGVFEYDGMQVLFQALKANPNDTSPGALGKRIRAVKMEGITGPISFDEKGDRPEMPWYAVRWKDGKFSPFAVVKGGNWEPVSGS